MNRPTARSQAPAQPKQHRSSSGITLVELIVSIAMLGILMVMIVGIVFPASQLLFRMQRIQHAQVIVDTVVKELRGQMREAGGAMKIYSIPCSSNRFPIGTAADMVGATEVGYDSDATGQILEYVTIDGAVVLISAEGTSETEIYRGKERIKTEAAIPVGQMVMRYYDPSVLKKNGDRTTVREYNYNYKGTKTDGGTVTLWAWAVVRPFAKDFYRKMYLTLEFTWGNKETNGNLRYVKATARLYDGNDANASVLAEATEAIDFRYAVQEYVPRDENGNEVEADGARNTALTFTPTSSPAPVPAP